MLSKERSLAIHFSSGVSHDPDYRKHLFAFVYVFCDMWNKGLQIFFRKNSPQDGFESGVLFMNFHLFLWQVVGSPVRQSHLLFSWLQRAGIRHRSPRLPIWQRWDQKLLTRTIGGIVRCSLEQYFRQIITSLIPNLLAGPLSSVIFLSMLLFDGCHRCPVGCREVVSGWGQAWQTGGKSEVRVHACSLFCGTLAETQINKWIIQRKVHPLRAWEVNF